jgi:hypothetical protein
MDMFVLLVDGRPDAVLASLDLAQALGKVHRAGGRTIEIVTLRAWAAQHSRPPAVPPEEKTRTSLR